MNQWNLPAARRATLRVASEAFRTVLQRGWVNKRERKGRGTAPRPARRAYVTIALP
jgi:predicted transcriptional regulator